jgi:ABC-type multidrug transport system fused ATPase/permease subunit
MQSDNFPSELNGGLLQQVEFSAQRDKLWNDLQTKMDGLERDLRRLVAAIIVYVLLQVFLYFTSNKAMGRMIDIIFIAAIGITLLLSRKEVIKMKGEVRELKSLIKQGES